MATREQLIEDFADHKYATGEKFARLINSMKVVQEPVADPAASGTSLNFIDSIEQDADGKITATKKTLDLSNAHELNPFKGWWKTGDTLPTSGFDGAYLYFKDTTQTPAVTTIYRWNGTAYADTGTEVDESNVQTFGSGQQVNEVKIKDENGTEVSGPADVLSAEAGKELNEQMNGKESNYEDGKKIRWTGGSSEVVEADSIFILSEYVQIPNGATTLVYTYANSSISPTGMSWYDESKIWLSSFGANVDSGERVLPIVNNAKYVRASFLKSTMGTRASLAFKDANNVVLETWVPMETQPSLFVKTTEQTFSDTEKAQARANIGAAAASDVAAIGGNIESLQSNQIQLNSRLTDVEESVEEVTGTERNYIPHKRVDASGAIVDRNTTGLSVLIPIESAVGTSVRFNVGTSNLTDSGLAFYSSDGTSFLGWRAGNEHPRTIQLDDYPSGAYLRMTFWLEEASSAYIEIKYAGDSDYARVWEPSEGTPSKYVQAKPQTFTEEEQNQIKRNLGIDKSGENVEFRMRNGSQGNAGNAYVITIYGKDTLAIPVEEGKKYKVVLNKQPEDGYEWFYSLFTYNTTSPSTLTANSIRNEGNQLSAHSLDEVITINSGELGLSIQLSQATHKGATPQSEYNHAIRISDFVEGDIEIMDVTNSTQVQLEEVENRLSVLEDSGVVARNADKLPMLVNSCRLYKSSNTAKDWQVVICTDMHALRKANQNAIAVVNDGFMVDVQDGSSAGNKNVPLIDAYINCGDIVGGDYTESAVITAFQTDFATLTKPGFVVLGNHDVGNACYVALCCNHSQAYTAFIKPMVDKGFLISGEYEVGKPYWYHDINNALRGYKLRIIGLYEYDDALDLNEVYWKAITYDSSLSNIQVSTSYSVGDKVNAGNYTEYSFECVQSVMTSTPTEGQSDLAVLRTDAFTGKAPAYKVQRGRRVIRQTQAQWFLDTLCSTPKDYGVIVIMHNPFSDSAKTMDNAFSWPANQLGSSQSQNDMATDFVRDAVAAFIAGSSYSANVVFKGKASYMNTEGGNTYAYSVAKDFSTKNSGVKFLGFVGGHAHRDFIWKDDTENIYQIAPNCAFSYGDNAKFSDIRRTDSDGLAFDSLTVASFADGHIGLVKIGVNVTDRGTKRDYMVLDTNN